jgi:hypothetical protein
MNDYLDSLRAPLGRAVDRAQGVVTQELKLVSQMGRYGNRIQLVVDRLHREFDTGVLVALARLKRARQQATLDYSQLWQATVQELENFTREVKSLVDREGIAGLQLSQLTLVNSELSKFDEKLRLALQHFQEGLLDVDAPPVPDATAGNLSAPLTKRPGIQAEVVPARQTAPALPDTSTLDVAGSQISDE